MKLQLIMLETPIIVNDEEIKEGDLIYTKEHLPDMPHTNISKCINLERFNLGSPSEWKKIISGLPELPSINFNGFEEQLGIIDVEKLALETYRDNPNKYNTDLNAPRKRKAFIKGFKAAQNELFKHFTLKDIETAFKAGEKYGRYKVTEDDYITFINKFLSQPKVFDIEVEMEELFLEEDSSSYTHEKNDVSGSKWFPKVINNQIKITKIL